MSNAENEGAEMHDRNAIRSIRLQQSLIQCPECNSQKVWKDGMRYTRHGEVQRYICRSCGLRFSENTKSMKKIYVPQQRPLKLPQPTPNLTHPRVSSCNFSSQKALNDPPLSRGENVTSHNASLNTPLVGKSLYTLHSTSSNRRVCVSEDEMKNLAEVESRTEKRAAGATETKPSEAEIKGKLVEYAWRMKNQGYQEGTIKNRVNTLKSLARRCNLLNPESVKEAIANTNVGEGRKYGMVDAYKSFASMFGISWRPPRYKLPRKIPFIPLEREVDDLIASSGRVMGTGLRIVKETGARVGEIIRLKWTDIDLVNRIIRFNDPEKGSQARALPMSSKLVAMLERSPKRNEYVFPGKYGHVSITGFSSNQAKARKVAARKLGNPRLLRISFHTIRHWKGTMEYHKTKDIIHVKSVLGHKNIENTMIYINLERISFQTTADEFTVRATNDMEEATKLLEVGFEYICEMDGYKLFRKRK